MKDLEKKIAKHLKERGWDNLRPADVAKSIMIEGAELLEHFQWDNVSAGELKKDKRKLVEIGEELADVFIYAIEMSVLLGLDSETVIRKKLAKAQKKYPAKLMKESEGKKSDKGSMYLKIKEEHRKKKKQ